MTNYKKIAEEALKRAKLSSLNNTPKRLNESVLYKEGMKERMHSQLENDLKERKHSLGKHEIFPESQESTFEEAIMAERFEEVVNRVKRAFECDSIDNTEIVSVMMPLVHETMNLESKHRKKLAELAVKMVREEYGMDEDVVEINAELTENISIKGTKKNPKPVNLQIEFDDHNSMVNANKEVYKRRFLNAMTQGAAKKCNHMFHNVDDDLIKIEPKLANKYAKTMAAADYMYYVIPKMENGISGGVVRVEFPKPTKPKAVIHAQAMIFPVLIHELVKGVMELLSAHGLPKDKKTGEFVISQADFLAAEPWDMRLGPALWSRFTNLLDANDFNLKHHVYSELAALPVDEFNVKMREIMANTKEGKNILKEITNRVKQELAEEEYNEAMNEINTSNNKNYDGNSDGYGFDFEELMSGSGDDNSDDNSDDKDGFNFDELF